MAITMQELEQSLRDAAEVEKSRARIEHLEGEVVSLKDQRKRYVSANTRLVSDQHTAREYAIQREEHWQGQYNSLLSAAAAHQRAANTAKDEAATARQGIAIAEGTAEGLRDNLATAHKDLVALGQRFTASERTCASFEEYGQRLEVELDDAKEATEEAERCAEAARLDLDVVKGKLAEALLANTRISQERDEDETEVQQVAENVSFTFDRLFEWFSGSELR